MNKKIFVASCQALKDEPLYGENIMTKMAQASIIGGADWIRTSQLDNVKNILKELDVPVIGLIKKNYPNSDVYITPTISELDSLIKTKVHIIAIDATIRKRPKENLKDLVDYFLKNKKEGQKLMADCATYEDVKNAIDLNFDFIGTTMRGSTTETKELSNKDNDFEFIKKIKKISNNIPIVAEGGISTPEEAKRAFEVGADIVVVGAAISRPRTIVKKFIDEIKKGV